MPQWRRRLQLQCFNFMREVKLLLRVPGVVKSSNPLHETFVLLTLPYSWDYLLLARRRQGRFRKAPAIILICLEAICLLCFHLLRLSLALLPTFSFLISPFPFPYSSLFLPSRALKRMFVTESFQRTASSVF